MKDVPKYAIKRGDFMTNNQVKKSLLSIKSQLETLLVKVIKMIEKVN